MSGRIGVVLFGLLMTVAGVGCGGNGLPDNARLLDAFEQGRTGVWVGGHGTVAQVLADATGGERPRQRFNVRIDEGLTVLIIHQVTDSGRVPAQRGDILAFHGRYEFNASGGTIAQTHRDDRQSGSGGWLRHEGVTYE